MESSIHGTQISIALRLYHPFLLKKRPFPYQVLVRRIGFTPLIFSVTPSHDPQATFLSLPFALFFSFKRSEIGVSGNPRGEASRVESLGPQATYPNPRSPTLAPSMLESKVDPVVKSQWDQDGLRKRRGGRRDITDEMKRHKGSLTDTRLMRGFLSLKKC